MTWPAVRSITAALILGLAVLMLAACSEGGEGERGAGGITAHAVWNSGETYLQTTAPTQYSTHPSTVVTVRASVSASDMDTITIDFTASANSGQIDGVPAGTGRTLTLVGLDSVGVAIFSGSVSGITVTAGAVTNAGTVTLNALSTTAAPNITTPSSNPFFSNTALATISGTCVGSSAHTIAMSGQETGTRACSGGNFSFTGLTNPGADGSYSYAFTQTKDSTGVVSAAVTLNWTLDTVLPGPVTITSPVPASITTGGNSLAISGACETGATVNLTGGSTNSAICTSSAYSITVTKTTDATYNFSLNQTDQAGNAAAAPVAQQWIRDTAPPTLPTITVPAANPAYAGGATTISGACTGTGTHTVSLSGQQSLGPVPCTGGAYDFTGTVIYPGTDGSYLYSVTQTKISNDVSSGSVSQTIIFDTAAPAPVVITSPSITPVTYNDSPLPILGTCETGATVNLSGDITAPEVSPGLSLTCTASAFLFNISKAVSPPSYTFTITQTDPAGNPSSSVNQVWTRDITFPPTPTITTPGSNPFYNSSPLTAISGACVTGNNVSMTGPGTYTSPFLCAASAYSFTITSPPSTGGTYSYVLRQNDGSNDSADVTLTFVLDFVAPGPVVVTNPASSPVTNSANSLIIAGTCETGATVNLTGASTQSADCISSAFSFTVDKFVDGTYNFSLTQSDLVPNTSTAKNVQWDRSTPIPATPTITTPSGSPFHSNTALTAISGTCISGTAHTVLLRGAQTDSVACASSAYSFAVTDPGADGGYTYFVTQSEDATGLESNAASLTWVFDTVAPALVTLTSPATSPVTSSETTLTIAGGCETDATVFLSVDDTQQVTCAASAFSFTVTKTVDGTYNFSLVQRDQALNLSDPVTQQWMRDSTVPATPVITTPGTNPFYSDTVLANIIGTCDGTNSVDLSGQEVLTQTCDAATADEFDFGITDPVVDGSYTYFVTQTNASLIESAPASLTWVLDTVDPAAPVVLIPSGGTVTQPGPLTISGTCEVNADVSIVRVTPTGGIPAGVTSPVTCPDGTFSFTFDEAATGDDTYTYDLAQTDQATNPSPATTVTWTRNSDSIPPPVITSPTVNPFISNDADHVILGTCISGFTVNLDIDSFFAQTLVCASDNFSFTVTSPADSTYLYEVTQTNGVNTSDPASVTWTKDTSGPDLTVSYKPVTPTNPTKDVIFEFSSTDGTAIFECDLDGTGYSGCVTPKVYTGLTGSHTVTIRSKDAAGNVDLGQVDATTFTQQFNDTLVLYHLNDTPDPLADDSLYPGDTPPIDSALTDSGTSSTTGVYSEGRLFESTNSDFMTTADNNAHRGTRSAMTVEAWVSIVSYPTGNGEKMTFVSKFDDTLGQREWEIGIRKQGGSSKFTLYLSAFVDGVTSTIRSKSVLDSGVDTPPTAFHHVAVTWSRGTVQFFFDGTLITTRTLGTAGVSLLPDSTTPLQLGRGDVDAIRFLDGVLDEVRISQTIRYMGNFTPTTPPDGNNPPYTAD